MIRICDKASSLRCDVINVNPTVTFRHPPVTESFQGLVSPLSLARVTAIWTPRTALTGLVSRSLGVPAPLFPVSSLHFPLQLPGVPVFHSNSD